MQTLFSLVGHASLAAANALLPWRCEGCGVITQTRGVCGSCFSQLALITQESCVSCGLPFEVSMAKRAQCLRCQKAPQLLKQLKAVFVYNAKSRLMILRFKHHRSFALLPFFVHLLCQRAQTMLKKIDLIAPVPLHWTRLLKRRFNQSGLLADQLAKKTSKPSAPALLKRVVRTPSQGMLTLKERHHNVKNAFAIHKRYKACVPEKRVLLVDDVCTTGATLNACAKTLLKQGAKEVYGLTLARVPLKVF
ncbi:MAG: ComF family protein [Holosporaceae bacterium]